MAHSNCTILNASGHTPLDLACQSGHSQVRWKVSAARVCGTERGVVYRCVNSI